MRARRTPSGRASFSDEAGSAAALRRSLTVIAVGLLPAVTLIAMFVVASSDDSLAADFHHEIYPQTEVMLDGRDPYPDPSFDPTAAPNFIWPPLDAYLHAPLTLFPPGVADVVVVVLGLLCFALALWVLDVRDWRVYGAFALWPQVAGEMRVSHLTPQLCLCAALAWRYRSMRLAPGLLVGTAIGLKFFVWPVVAWLVATRRLREAMVAVAVAGATLLLVVPFGLPDYVRALLQLGEAFDQDSYSVFGLLVQAGTGDGIARSVTWVIGAALLLLTLRYRSFTLAIASALALTPIAWLDYFALAALPLAIARPRLSLVWFLPLATWGLEGAGLGIGDTAGTVRLLTVFAIVLGVSFAAERRGGDVLDTPASYRARAHPPEPAGRLSPS